MGRDMKAGIYDTTRCELGEGPLWHPTRNQLFWFDILAGRLHWRENGATRMMQFDELVSAAGWIDDTALLVASESRLFRFDLETGTTEDVVPLEADNPLTRSNDGRADPWGGFWIGTMGKGAEPGLGAIYRYHAGELRQLHAPITIPNAISFAPDRSVAYFTDSPVRIVWRQPLDPETCPAFGGPDLRTLYCTSAMEGITAEMRAAVPEHGMTFFAENVANGRAEPRVIL
jgi:sugar lactone lactonase YvrE